ncbi:type III flagellar switch regulator (C-ring) FliN [Hasllibacter halocynthiae]|uniref:Type III flagellar switch regulator (C-ring) FliN n=1 Tax=Hasllibacter halocynthiae TaxID=595589 RepID=A0A2T0X7G5_9RHOB|nr:FliM/FliN family flagellar motor C-terminal domain-containing protein [Hasllibacter halocynthiae]PRY94867.1 type III flagellar switch regulator (C-ring) FliN [Hasllibacter halocynthiae]
MALAAPDLLPRLLRRPSAARTPARAAVMGAVPRLAERWTGMPLVPRNLDIVLGERERLAPLPEGPLLAFSAENAPRDGFAVFTPNLADAVAEWRLTGRPLAGTAPTGGGIAAGALCASFAAELLALVDEVASWLSAGPRPARPLNILLEPGLYERIELHLAGKGVDGRIVLLRPVEGREGMAPDLSGGPVPLSRKGSRAPLRAVLARARIPLAQIEGLTVGTVLPLNGIGLSGATLEAKGRSIASGRVGRAGTVRALRLHGTGRPNGSVPDVLSPADVMGTAFGLERPIQPVSGALQEQDRPDERDGEPSTRAFGGHSTPAPGNDPPTSEAGEPAGS